MSAPLQIVLRQMVYVDIEKMFINCKLYFVDPYLKITH